MRYYAGYDIYLLKINDSIYEVKYDIVDNFFLLKNKNYTNSDKKLL